MFLLQQTESFADGEESRGSGLHSAPTWLPIFSRRSCVAAACLLAALTAHGPSARAQDKPIQIGVLALGPRYLPEWTCGQSNYQVAAVQSRKEATPVYALGLVEGLTKLKYVEDRPENASTPGRRFVIHLRTGTSAQLRESARELVAMPVDFIVAIATAAVRIAQDETKGRNIPILMTGVSDPVQYGAVQSLSRPGGNVTGVSHQLVQGSAKRVELFKQMLPDLQRLITMRNPGYTPSEKSIEEVRAAAARHKIEVLDVPVRNRADIQAAMAKVETDKSLGIMILADSLTIANIDLILERSLAYRVPTFGLMAHMATWGAVAASGPSAFQAGSRVAGYIDKIVKGEKPGLIPIEPIEHELVVNLKAAQCLGINVPLDVLSQADRVIR